MLGSNSVMGYMKHPLQGRGCVDITSEGLENLKEGLGGGGAAENKNVYIKAFLLSEHYFLSQKNRGGWGVCGSPGHTSCSALNTLSQPILHYLGEALGVVDLCRLIKTAAKMKVDQRETEY